MKSPGLKPNVMSGLVIHDEVVCSSVAASGRYAKLAASKKALDLLHGLALFEYREKFGCDCKAPDPDEVVEEIDVGTAI